MKVQNKSRTWTILAILGSARFALVLVAVLILFCLVGTMLPQEGQHLTGEIEQWQTRHQTITSLCNPLGLFKFFHSIPFLSTIFLLAVNTLICSLTRFIRLWSEHGLMLFSGISGLRHAGFLILHASLILLFLGGAMSAAFSLDGFIPLTEGQKFLEQHSAYLRISEGPFRPERHKKISLQLNKAWEQYQNEYVIKRGASVTLMDTDGQQTNAEILINKPLTFNTMDITLDEVGFSPRIVIIDRKTGKQLVDSFVALRLFEHGNVRLHQDFLPLPALEERNQRMVVTVFPAHATVDNTTLLTVDLQNTNNDETLHAEIPLTGNAEIGEYVVAFRDIRRWASFRLMEDQGYNLAMIALWGGLLGIIFRYIPDLKKWFSTTRV